MTNNNFTSWALKSSHYFVLRRYSKVTLPFYLSCSLYSKGHKNVLNFWKVSKECCRRNLKNFKSSWICHCLSKDQNQKHKICLDRKKCLIKIKSWHVKKRKEKKIDFVLRLWLGPKLEIFCSILFFTHLFSKLTLSKMEIKKGQKDLFFVSVELNLIKCCQQHLVDKYD